MDFNPRTPCGVRQHPVVLFITTLSNFNPRTPCGVRPCSRLPMHTALHFNPRTPCGVRRCRACCGGGGLNISIHAPLAGCDFINHNGEFIAHLFQSTHPLRGATHAASRFTSFCLISIHAPLAGCDLEALVPRVHAHDFNPRTPCGVRRGCGGRPSDRRDFNPRTPCGVRHHRPHPSPRWLSFQSTHPLRGATQVDEHVALGRDFNPRTPCGVRQQKRTKKTALFLN